MDPIVILDPKIDDIQDPDQKEVFEFWLNLEKNINFQNESTFPQKT